MVTQDQRDLRDRLIDLESGVDIKLDWVKMDTERRQSGQNGKVKWNAEFDLPTIGDTVIVWPGCCSGVVADYGIKQMGKVFERAVWVKVDDCEFIKLSGRECKPLTDEDKLHMEEQNKKFRKRLIAAGKKVERQRKERRQRQVKGSHLLEEMLSAASGFEIDEKSSYYKIMGTAKGRKVYVAVKGGRVDISGFSMDHPCVTNISADEARKRHLGSVRGQFDFTMPDPNVMEAFEKALQMLNE